MHGVITLSDTSYDNLEIDFSFYKNVERKKQKQSMKGATVNTGDSLYLKVQGTRQNTSSYQ